MSGSTTLQRPATPAAARAPRRDWPRKVIAGLIVLSGAALVAMTLIVNLFKVGPAFERLTDNFRPVMTQSSIQSVRSDVNGLSAAGKEFQTKLAPALATQLNLTPAQFQALMAQFPAVAAGVTAIPKVVPTFNGLVTTLDQQRPLFASADAIPTKNLPATTLPWGLLVAGLAAIGVGVYAWFAPRRGAVVSLVLGGVLVAVPLIMNLPQKASDADQMNANLKPVYTQQLITQATSALTTMGAMGTEMQTKMLPALATQLHMSPAQLDVFLSNNFPALTSALRELPASMGRFEDVIATFQQELKDYQTLKPVELVPIVWTVIGVGGALMLLGIAGLVASKPRKDVITA